MRPARRAASAKEGKRVHTRTIATSKVAYWTVLALACAAPWAGIQAQDAPPPIPVPNFADAPAYPVTGVVNERTVTVQMEQEERRLALAGVRSPKEKSSCERLRRFVENLLTAEAVLVRYDSALDTDTEGSKPAYLFRAPDGLFVNLEVVRQGYARVETRPAFEHRELLRYYERRAKTAKKGIWAPQPRPKEMSAARVATSQPTGNAEEIIVYVTKSGKKYHRKDCQYLRKSAIPITLKEAIARGYEPCSRCKPPTLENP
jgi:endonuclease YncB( thermonuclease family)